MVNITYIEHDGTEHLVEAKSGKSLMENAVDNHSVFTCFIRNHRKTCYKCKKRRYH